MRSKHTIQLAITEVLRSANEPLSPEAIFHQITIRSLYEFQTENPLHVVSSALRRYCLDLDFPSARSTKYFKQIRVNGAAHYELLAKPIKVSPTAYKVRPPNLRGKEAIITISSDREDGGNSDTFSPDPGHTEIQWKLIELGSQLGLSTWAPVSDRNRSWNGNSIKSVPGLLKQLPPQFHEASMKIVSNIDVIWVSQRAIIAAFEIEHTTPVYSGLLRMADLMSLQPNSDIKWYLVAPEDRFSKFANEVTRPTFASLRKPLHTVCKFISYSKLISRLNAAQEFVSHLKPEFLDGIAEQYDPKEAFGEKTSSDAA